MGRSYKANGAKNGVKLALLCGALEASLFTSNKASPLPLGYKLHEEVDDAKIFHPYAPVFTCFLLGET